MEKSQAIILGFAIAAVGGIGVFSWKYQDWVAIPKARQPLLSYLKDPASAQFRNEHIMRGQVLCGEVNSKNSMGGYVGFKRFILAGPEANYIEEGGPLGRWSTPDLLLRLDEENVILKRFVKYQKEFPGMPAPSDSERQDIAMKRVFDRKWEEFCEPSKT